MEPNSYTDFKSIMIALREERGWSPAELARRSGLSNAAISYIESGQKTASYPSMGKIASAFGMEMTELLAAITNKEMTSGNSELVEWALRPENEPYLEFIYNLSKEVPPDQLDNLEVKKTLNIKIKKEGE